LPPGIYYIRTVCEVDGVVLACDRRRRQWRRSNTMVLCVCLCVWCTLVCICVRRYGNGLSPSRKRFLRPRVRGKSCPELLSHTPSRRVYPYISPLLPIHSPRQHATHYIIINIGLNLLCTHTHIHKNVVLTITRIVHRNATYTHITSILYACVIIPFTYCKIYTWFTSHIFRRVPDVCLWCSDVWCIQ